MKHYIDPKTKDIFAYEADGSQDEFIKPGLVPISDGELAELRKPTQEQLNRDAYNKSRLDRNNAVSNIKVKTSIGNTFDGDEVSQGRIARTIVAMQSADTQSIKWKLADNTITDVAISELVEVLNLSVAEQTKLWIA